ncbi:MAG: hypothetical protein QM775_34520 [Pirellulales bacterium]
MAAAVLIVVGLGGVWWKLKQTPQAGPIAQNRPSQDLPAPLPPRGSSPIPIKSTASPSPTPSATAAPSVPQPTASATAGPALPPEPWTAMLAAAPQKFDDFWFSTCRLTRDVEGLQRWWETRTGQQRPANNDERYGLQLGGLFELRAPWPAGSTLTLWTTEVQNEIARLHLWTGEQGVTLELRQRPYEHWTAYRSTKRPAEPLPQRMIFASGDNDRALRTGEGPLDLRWHEGRVLLSRGDILLLTAPLAEPPQSVWFEGTAVLKGIGLSHVEGMPKRWIGDDSQWPSYFDLPKGFAGKTVKATNVLSELPAGATDGAARRRRSDAHRRRHDEAGLGRAAIADRRFL